METVDLNGKPFHFIGIGGIGMSALAYVLAQRNLPVSGSDLRSSHITQRLASVGARIFNCQIEDNLNLLHSPTGAAQQDILPQVVCSTAIGRHNPEFQAAQSKGCSIFHRSDVLSALVSEYESIAVGGTHGKTTTSSLIGYIFLEAGLDPTIIVGGEVDAWEGNARLGLGKYLVAEADESDGTLVKLNAKLGIITNIELDHPDHYQSLDEVVRTFQLFAERCQTTICCLDCPTIVAGNLDYTIGYAIDNIEDADYWATEIQYGSTSTRAVIWERGDRLGEINLTLLGKHNLANALAAIAVARCCDIPFPVISQALSTFGGAKRRFEVKGKCQGITFIDDYAHHPSEISATLGSARLRAGNDQRVVAVFQPHRYSRTAKFLDEFARSFSDADWVIVTDIYGAGESNPHNLTGEILHQAIAKHQSPVDYHADYRTVPQWLAPQLKAGDLVLLLGAGNLNQTVATFLEQISPENAPNLNESVKC